MVLTSAPESARDVAPAKPGVRACRPRGLSAVCMEARAKKHPIVAAPCLQSGCVRAFAAPGDVVSTPWAHTRSARPPRCVERTTVRAHAGHRRRRIRHSPSRANVRRVHLDRPLEEPVRELGCGCPRVFLDRSPRVMETYPQLSGVEPQARVCVNPCRWLLPELSVRWCADVRGVQLAEEAAWSVEWVAGGRFEHGGRRRAASRRGCGCLPWNHVASTTSEMTCISRIAQCGLAETHRESSII